MRVIEILELAVASAEGKNELSLCYTINNDYSCYTMHDCEGVDCLTCPLGNMGIYDEPAKTD